MINRQLDTESLPDFRTYVQSEKFKNDLEAYLDKIRIRLSIKVYIKYYPINLENDEGCLGLFFGHSDKPIREIPSKASVFKETFNCLDPFGDVFLNAIEEINQKYDKYKLDPYVDTMLSFKNDSSKPKNNYVSSIEYTIYFKKIRYNGDY